MDTIRALGYDYMETPNLDRLVEEGVTFTNCHIHRGQLRAVTGQFIYRLLPSHLWRFKKCRPLAPQLGGKPGGSRFTSAST